MGRLPEITLPAWPAGPGMKFAGDAVPCSGRPVSVDGRIKRRRYEITAERSEAAQGDNEPTRDRRNERTHGDRLSADVYAAMSAFVVISHYPHVSSFSPSLSIVRLITL